MPNKLNHFVEVTGLGAKLWREFITANNAPLAGVRFRLPTGDPGYIIDLVFQNDEVNSVFVCERQWNLDAWAITKQIVEHCRTIVRSRAT